jgi:Fur family zinc uptake transcriptional regulator
VSRKSASQPAVFPAPGHDHGRCESEALAHAEAICTRRAQRLTPIRRQVLRTLLGSHRPLGAYEIIDRMNSAEAQTPPITVYRALDFLREQGLVHRIESRNAFIACIHQHDAAEAVVFLLCEQCGAVGEAGSNALAGAVQAAARAAGFVPKTPVIEIPGVCAHCRTQPG